MLDFACAVVMNNVGVECMHSCKMFGHVMAQRDCRSSCANFVWLEMKRSSNDLWCLPNIGKITNWIWKLLLRRGRKALVQHKLVPGHTRAFLHTVPQLFYRRAILFIPLVYFFSSTNWLVCSIHHVNMPMPHFSSCLKVVRLNFKKGGSFKFFWDMSL